MNALLVGAFIFLFLYVFKPFEMSDLKHGIFEIALGYGLVTTIVMQLLSLLLKALKGFSDEERWTVGKAIFWNMLHLILIEIFNALYSDWIGLLELTLKRLLWFQMATLAIGVFPVITMVLISEAAMNRKYLLQSNIINQEIALKEHDNAVADNFKNDMVLLMSQNENASLSISAEQILFVKASDNYVEVYFTENQTIQKRLLRNTLKSIEEVLKENINFFRCHKSYLVNLHKILKVKGNAQGYRFKLNMGEFEIPVSRQHNERIHELV